MTRVSMLAVLFALGCAPEAPLLGDAQAPPGFTLDATDMILGGTQTFRVQGAPPNATLYIVRSFTGEGAGACPNFLRGSCFDILNPVKKHATVTATNVGTVSETLLVDPAPALEGSDVCFQAAAPGRPVTLTPPVCVGVGTDSDGDGTVDHHDACPGEDDRLDWDGDGLPDACDPDGGPPTYATATYDVPFDSMTFQGRTVRYSIPAGATGIVWFFHGSYGDSEVVDSPEGVVGFQSLLDAGLGVIATESDNAKWDDNNDPATNRDWPHVDAVRDQLIAGGHFTASTPSYLIGFSNGGAFASYMAHVAPAAGWPIKAIATRQSSTRSDLYGDPPGLPILFQPAVNDTTVDAAALVARYDAHVAAGHDGALLWFEEDQLAPTRFARSSFINASTSQTLWDLVVSEGYFDRNGHRTFAGDVDTTIDEIGALAGFDPPRPGKGVLKAVLGVHVLIGSHGEDEAAFFLAHP